MKVRRGLALVMTVVASAAVVTSAAAPASASASASSGKQTICVALVVDGRSIGSDVSTTCAKVAKGSTGVDVLEKAGHTVSFRSDGLLCTIDGLPKGGCGAVNDTHYWAYFHRAPGARTWTYSSEGASTYEPANDATEGWVYDDGKALTPQNVPYDQICKSDPTPTPTRTATPTPTPRATPTHHATSAAATTTPTTTPSPTVTASAVSARHLSRPSRRAHPTTPATPPASAPAPAASPSATSAALVGGATPPANHHGWLDLLIGLVIVAAIGISAAVRFRRSTR